MGFVEGIDVAATRVIMTITFAMGMIRNETYTSRDAFPECTGGGLVMKPLDARTLNVCACHPGRLMQR